ncbi:MAG TPA: hypothetical protein DCR72_13850 [Pseudomonas sp.]|nr:hypothetical protein [Pseudomonas sp.]
MTVQTNTNVANFLGNGAATYPIGFKFNSAADLVVQKTVIATGVTTTLTLNSDYSVAGAGVEEGGSITFSQAPTSAESIKVTRVVDLLQLTDLRNQGKFYAEVHEEVFDKLVMVDQQQQTEINDANAKSDESVATANAANAKSDQAVAKAAQNLVDMQAQYDAFEQGASFVVIGDYTAGLVVDGYNKIFRKDGEFYRAKADLTLPYPLTGDWAVDAPKFVSVGDDVLRQELAAPGGAALVGYMGGTVADALGSAPLSVKAYGAVGDGLTDDTAAIQACLDDAAAKGAYVVGSPLDVYSVSTITIPAGIRAVDFTQCVIKGQGTAPDAVVVLGDYAQPLGGSTVISITLDMSNGDRSAIEGRNTSDTIIRQCRIYGFTNHATLNHYGIVMRGQCNRNLVCMNHITGVLNPTQRGLLIDFLAEGQADFGGFYTGVITRATGPCVGNVISDNILIDGSYAVNMLGGERNVIKGNYCYNQNHRSMYFANTSWENIIECNVLREYKSSGILLGYGASRNIVANNTIMRDLYDGGEAAINVIVGAQRNLIEGNKIYASANYGVYLACDVIGNIVQNNDVQNHYIAAFAIENDWKNPRPTNAIYSRPNYAAPEGDAWSHVDSADNVIANNTIRAGYTGRNTGAVALAQIDALGNTSLIDNVVVGNRVISSTNVNVNLHFYADTPAKLTGTVVTDNAFRAGVNFVSSTVSSTSAGFADRIAYYSGNRGLDRLLSSEPIPLPIGNTTPSVTTNAGNPSERVFSLQNTSATSVTNFTNGYDGQEITVRMDAFTTLVHDNALMRLKGNVNIAPTSTNNFVRLRRASGVWFEVGRSF